jgi:hypothetical protein
MARRRSEGERRECTKRGLHTCLLCRVDSALMWRLNMYPVGTYGALKKWRWNGEHDA